MIQSELDQIAASIETLQAKQTNLGFKLSKLAEREDDLADTCEFYTQANIPLLSVHESKDIPVNAQPSYLFLFVSGRSE